MAKRTSCAERFDALKGLEKSRDVEKPSKIRKNLMLGEIESAVFSIVSSRKVAFIHVSFNSHFSSRLRASRKNVCNQPMEIPAVHFSMILLLPLSPPPPPHLLFLLLRGIDSSCLLEDLYQRKQTYMGNWFPNGRSIFVG